MPHNAIAVRRFHGAAAVAVVLACRLLLACTLPLLSAALALGGDSGPASTEVRPQQPGQVLILVGLPGDEEHEKLFADTVKQWRRWLSDTLGFQPTDVHVLFGKSGQEGLAQGPATRVAIENEAARLKESLRPGDRLWVFFLGHANYDGEHAWLHLPGPDLNDDELGKLFAGISCREQVFWMTTSESGRFVKGLSAKGRIVIAATRAGNEDNETEFPHALSTVAALPLTALDANKDGKLSVLELYSRIVREVQERYSGDNRVPTEHAQLDDNGDGVGTERPLDPQPDKNAGPNDDGVLSQATLLPYVDSPPRPVKAEKEEPPQPIKPPGPSR